MIKKNHVGDLVVLNWEDACSSSAWMDPIALKEWEPAKIETVGWIMVQNKKQITICGARGNDLEGRLISNFSEVTAIPISWVQKITVLKSKDLLVTSK